MKTMTIAILFLLTFGLMMTACSKSASQDALSDLDVISVDLLANLKQIDAAMATQIAFQDAKLSTEEEIRILLMEALPAHPAVMTSCYVDPNGILAYLEPEDYGNAEGVDISQQAHTITMLEYHAPVLSSAFRAVEGFTTIAMARPLFDDQNDFAGSLVLTMDPAIIIQMVLDKHGVSSELDLIAMEPDGTIVGYQDNAMIGINVFSDPQFQSHEFLQSIAAKAAELSKGQDEYSVVSTEEEDAQIKAAAWQTITMHGKDWRVILMQK